MKLPKMLDNKRTGTVSDELKDSLKKGSKMSVISAYFTIFAYEELKKELGRIDKMRFIFTEPSYVENDSETYRQYYIDRTEMGGQTIGDLATVLLTGSRYEIKLRNEMRQAAIAKECADWITNKAEMKSLRRPNPAQPRLIHIDNSTESEVITGTVDFTSDGLGITPSNRLDTNVCIYGPEFTLQYLRMFDELWNDTTAVEDVKQNVLKQMQVLYKENTPEFIYFVTLYNIFSQYLDELTEDKIIKTRTGFKNTQIWNKLYKFQKDGAMGIIDKIEKYNGCIIADSVGLGKTFTALAVVKYYELRNDRVLVLCPKKLRENWTIYTLNDKRNIFVADRFNYDVLNHTDLSRQTGLSGTINLATINWSNYDLVVIDESHNFRNNNPSKNRVTRYERMMNEVIKAGVKTKILMLSATPVNNRMNDIKNQIAFITEGNDRALSEFGLPSIDFTLRKAQIVFNRWSELSDQERTTDHFVEMMDIDYFKLLDTVTIARSRRHIEKYYNIEEIGKFPQRNKPINKYPEIDSQGEYPPLEQVNKLIRRLTLAMYSPLLYVLPEKRSVYEEKYDMRVGSGNSTFKQADRERQLVALMRVNMLKRMESSIHSFTLTVSKILSKVNITLEKIDQHQFEYDPSINIADIDLDESENDDLLFGNKIKVLLQDMDLIKWRQDLEDDRIKLETLLQDATKITAKRDEKLHELKILIENKIRTPINPGNRKIVIFTAFADTASYLYANLAEWLQQNFGIYAAMVTGTGDNHSTLPVPKSLRNKIHLNDYNTLLTCFSPNSKECAKIFPGLEDKIDLLIGTDCISEGQNLQDSDYLVNYDIHWNPVRIIQRFGRIDRIGSINDSIQLVNFWPNMALDEYINLENRVQGRMVLLDVSATGEENLIEVDDMREMRDLEYRKKQLIRLKEEVVDLEEISGGISITDLTFNDFKMDLMEYMSSNRHSLDAAPLGMYAITRSEDTINDCVQPGVIFTLRQVDGQQQPKEQNALAPYFMVYITDSGEVLLNHLHAKKMLDIYRKICHGKQEVLSELAAQFNKDTNDGYDMRKYTTLLDAALQNILGKKEETGVASLFSKGGTHIQKSLFSGLESYELVSFLIIK